VLDGDTPRIYAAYHGREFKQYVVEEVRRDMNTYTWFKLNITDTEATAITKFLTNQLGVSYNYGVYLSCPTGYAGFKHPSISWFCSEICAVVLRDFLPVPDTTHVLVAPTPATVTPNALLAYIHKRGLFEMTAAPAFPAYTE